MDGIEFSKHVAMRLEKTGLGLQKGVNYSYKEKADYLRKFYINFYETDPVNNFCDCFRKQKLDNQYNLKAYEMMTDKQILMSEARERKIRDEETSKFLKDLDESQKISENSKLEVRACAIAV